MDLNISYCSDKYQYTMGKSFYDSGMKDKRAVFNLFYRKAPDTNNWAVVSGITEVLEVIKGLNCGDESFFEQFLPGENYKEVRQYFANMKFTGNVYAMREGEIAFPTQPIITIEAPIIEGQVLETPLLSIMNHQMAVATKASRVTRSTTKPVSEFGSRRAHGPWAAIYGGKAAIIGGCANSSNIVSGMTFGFPSTGTMAHSYVTSFGCSIKGEFTAFDTYIKTHKSEVLILLIDTYDTLRCGVKNAIKAFKENGIDDNYPYGYGIRLDSGDLTYLSVKCREMLDEAGLKKCKIFATNALDEYLITELERQGCQVDSYGVGDAIATSKHNPCFGNVFKLVQIDDMPVLKRSEDRIKLINPGFQITYRIIQNNKFKVDVTCLRGDDLSKDIEAGKTITVRDERDRFKSMKFEEGKYEFRTLQQQIVKDGEIIYQDRTIQEKQAYYKENLAHLDDTQKRLINPHYYKCDISDALYDLKNNPYSRRIMTNIYVHQDLHEMNLYPCAYSVTFNVTKKPGHDKLTLNAILNQRSQDILAANNWNVVQYAVLVYMMAQVCDMEPGELVHVIADAHIYDRHIDIVKELIKRPTYPAPKFSLNPEIKDFYQFTTDDIKIEDYQAGEQIKNIPIAV